MKIDLAIFAATSGHSGVDRVLRNLVPEIARLGLRVDVLGIDGHGPHFDALPDGMRHLRLGARHVYTALPALVRYLRRTRPQALLTDKDRVNRTALCAQRLARTATRLYFRQGTTVSVDLASRGLTDRWVQSWSMRTLYRLADGLLVPSHGAADDLAAFAGVAREAIRVVPSPIVTPELSAKAAEPIDHPWAAAGQPPLILGVGELSERKDFATLLHAFAQVRACRPCRLMILGEGRRRVALEKLAVDLGVAADVALPGFCPNPYPWMAKAAVFALTSRWEGMPVVLIEALALGTPSVACDCPSGPREVLDGGRHGALAPVGDIAAVAAGLLRQLDTPTPAAVSRAAVQGYTAEASARAYLAALGFGEFQ
ncbi:MAG TPA: glycosyltransferase [Pseudothauera hydrothermalis]|jgi:glycosyltransferase involved in cell wall biosynthesis|uniref:glycosyltransferase n=1 Tax=Pseudothauera hydrothermalis TaxID=2184083 RepID=UPI000C7C1EFF|nr:glycosyltransferase [Pseudothauera hydrothermalis]AUM01042.1 glycosyl transferase [Rhodocyclaceae bacterium]AVZ80204.1 glycosyltransferase [Zoogloeaceae bacteirum Par-f-2]HNQ75037.1 glycosyltransferase [Pseudothauera hydrothermalis]